MKLHVLSSLLKDPADKTATVKVVAEWVGRPLPSAYLAYLLGMARLEVTCKATLIDGGGIAADGITLYPPERLISLNEELQTKSHCPGYIAIGLSADGRAVLVPIEEGTRGVFLAPSDGLDPRRFKLVADNVLDLTR